MACDAVRILSNSVHFLSHVGLIFSKYRQVFSIWQGTWPLSSLNSLPRDSVITEERCDLLLQSRNILEQVSAWVMCLPYVNLSGQAIGQYY